MGVPKTSDHIQINIRVQNPSQEPPVFSKAPYQDLKDIDVLCTLISRWRAKIWNMGVPKTSEHIQINVRMQTPSQEPPASSKVPNPDLKDMDVLCSFIFNIESQNLEYGCTKDQ